VNAVELAQHAGITYRQLDSWTRAGYLHPVNLNAGSGRHRDYSYSDVAIAVRMGRLVNAGMTVQAAYAVAQGEPAAVRSLREALEACA